MKMDIFGLSEAHVGEFLSLQKYWCQLGVWTIKKCPKNDVIKTMIKNLYP